MSKFGILLVLLATYINPASAACDIRLKGPVPNCPAVAYSIEDCDQTSMVGKKGTKVYFTIIHIMTNGMVFAGGGHEAAVELKNLLFKNCRFSFLDRMDQESPEYASHLVVK
ncbi:hypothetical protein EN962_00340 [Mesorhizobium sp. M7A.F.Ca.CA.001.09.2.1]|uniref:Uncharacterized protein n=1 Tax=Mesorhizobium ciceri TaxID=39645 RepID=A0AB38TAT7_9HYPH|nr:MULTISPECIES: hypothetical protein [Mesorhizobium]RUY59333.1 hypothetical protein EN981_01220 [Mesorhizobium sp. M7A.F.Ca.CA.001.13.2.1]MDF3214824.1 hypothetical protein [Mesorhizobium ciceri]RUY73029.1 hypothetical protein EN980_01545 [Mesorhizobium sp. M7A.F.Ca.CA.001.13.1.1]RUY74473.1 hypothetical protein EN965_00960 [Mesorhizobium sp. M7A.F.Ca.CA.001.05.1.1]RUY81952.1 hypothetical protein EN962_00340 [Mesorhizobium sp. M7A.F.Ca.CA.001.09.2.1]